MPERIDGHADPARRNPDVPPLPRVRMARRRRPPVCVPGERVAQEEMTTAERQDLDYAVNNLRRRQPNLSAGEPIWPWQRRMFCLALPAVAATAIIAPEQTIFFVAAVLVLPFFCVVVLRAAALWHTSLGYRPPTPIFIDIDPPALPRYTLLIPLFEEGAIVPDLIKALAAIDYPEDKIEVLLILESGDAVTRAAIEVTPRPPHMSVVIVPAGSPRTKPRALNYALRRATGDLIVVYDAEDVPEPDQLRHAAKLLMADPKLGCVQARLNVLNDKETLLTRQFAIEYTVLFDCILPTLERLRLPVPLGGTSNHFSRSALENVGSWDPFNVTEDADLGIRFARYGWTVKVLASTTWEEAPASFTSWLKQRTRWLKGWMQTYLVHMRRPMQTVRDLGWLRFFGLQVFMGGLILSALVHPWFYAVAIADFAYGPLNARHHHALSDAVKVIGIANLILGYATGAALGCIAVAARGRRGLSVWALLMPFYWLLISLAAYRALFQLASTPYRWEKTEHRPRAAFASPQPAE